RPDGAEDGQVLHAHPHLVKRHPAEHVFALEGHVELPVFPRLTVELPTDAAKERAIVEDADSGRPRDAEVASRRSASEVLRLFEPYGSSLQVPAGVNAEVLLGAFQDETVVPRSGHLEVAADLVALRFSVLLLLGFFFGLLGFLGLELFGDDLFDALGRNVD